MNIRELKNILAHYPEDMPVIVAGYEGGYNDLSAVRHISILRDTHSESYMGQHDDAPNTAPDAELALLLTGINFLAEADDA